MYLCVAVIKFVPIKGNKISKRHPILSSSSSRWQKWQQKITLNSNLLYKFKWGVIFRCHFWHRLEDEVEIGGLFEILLPLKWDKNPRSKWRQNNTITKKYSLLDGNLLSKHTNWTICLDDPEQNHNTWCGY